MTTPTTPPARPGFVRRFGWLGWTSLIIVFFCILLLILVKSHTPTMSYSSPGPVSTAGKVPSFAACMSYDDHLNVDPGGVASVGVQIAAGACGDAAAALATNNLAASTQASDERARADLDAAFKKGLITKAQADKQISKLHQDELAQAVAVAEKARRDVTIGSKVKVAVVAPLFDGSVGAVADETQTFDDQHTTGRWQWQVRPNKPGDFELPLKLTIYDSEGKEALTDEAILNVHVHAPMTMGYVITGVWTAIGGFLTSFQGVIASVGAIAGGTAGFRAWVARKSKRNVAPGPATASNGGYL